MKRFFTEQRKVLTEMAAPKSIEGVKRTRSKTYSSTHDIHVDGEHVATIHGYKPNSWNNGGSHESWAQGGHSTQFGKIYTVHPPTGDHQLNHAHPDHAWTSKNEIVAYHPKLDEHGKPVPHPFHNDPSIHEIDHNKPIYKDVQRPLKYGSMEHAVQSVVHTHRNNKEFGKGHNPHVRWQKAIDATQGAEAHQQKHSEYTSAINNVKRLGHDDLAAQLETHRDAHIAAGAGGVSKKKLKQWTHDAHRVEQKRAPGQSYYGNEMIPHTEAEAREHAAYNVHNTGNPSGKYHHSW